MVRGGVNQVDFQRSKVRWSQGVLCPGIQVGIPLPRTSVVEAHRYLQPAERDRVLVHSVVDAAIELLKRPRAGEQQGSLGIRQLSSEFGGGEFVAQHRTLECSEQARQ